MRSKNFNSPLDDTVDVLLDDDRASSFGSISPIRRDDPAETTTNQAAGTAAAIDVGSPVGNNKTPPPYRSNSVSDHSSIFRSTPDRNSVYRTCSSDFINMSVDASLAAAGCGDNGHGDDDDDDELNFINRSNLLKQRKSLSTTNLQVQPSNVSMLVVAAATTTTNDSSDSTTESDDLMAGGSSHESSSMSISSLQLDTPVRRKRRVSRKNLSHSFSQDNRSNVCLMSTTIVTTDNGGWTSPRQTQSQQQMTNGNNPLKSQADTMPLEAEHSQQLLCKTDSGFNDMEE